MTVKELREALARLPDDLPIVHFEGEYGYCLSTCAQLRAVIIQEWSLKNREALPQALVIE